MAKQPPPEDKGDKNNDDGDKGKAREHYQGEANAQRWTKIAKETRDQ